MPAPLQRAAVDLGKIARMLEDHSELADAGFRFYSHCTLREDLPNSIRALCYSHLPELDSRLAGMTGFDPEAYPAQVRELAEKLSP